MLSIYLEIIITLINLNYFNANVALPEHSNNECMRLFIKNIIGRSNRNILITPDRTTEFLEDHNSQVFIRTSFNNVASLLPTLEFKPINYIIFSNNLDILNGTFETIIWSALFTSQSSFIIFTEEMSLVEGAMKLLWEYKSANLYVVYEETVYTEVYTLGLKKCGSLAYARRLDIETSNKCIPPTKADLRADLSGCPLNVITVDTPPFLFAENNEIKGILYEFMLAFEFISQRKLIFFPPNPEYLDELEGSYYFGSIIEDFENGRAELFLGHGQVNVIEILDIGPVLLRDNLVFLIPRKHLSYMDVILLSGVQLKLFVYFVGLFGVSLVFYLIVRQTRDIDIFVSAVKTYLVFFGISLNVSTLLKLPRRQHIRILFASILLTTVVLSTELQGFLIGSMSSGPIYGPHIKSVEELLKRPEIPIKLPTALGFFFSTSNRENYMEVYKRHSTIESNIALKDVPLEEFNFAAALTESFLIIRADLLESFSVFELFANHRLISMPKNYFLHEKFYKWFTMLFESGFLEKFTQLYKFKYSLQYAPMYKARVFQISLKHIGPALIILFGGYIIALAAFIIELVVHKIIKKFE